MRQLPARAHSWPEARKQVEKKPLDVLKSSLRRRVHQPALARHLCTGLFNEISVNRVCKPSGDVGSVEGEDQRMLNDFEATGKRECERLARQHHGMKAAEPQGSSDALIQCRAYVGAEQFKLASALMECGFQRCG